MVCLICSILLTNAQLFSCSTTTERNSRICKVFTSSGLVILLIGQVRAHDSQPVQSSGDTCTTNLALAAVAGLLFKCFGALAISLSEIRKLRIAAWGQTRAHCPHWAHLSGFHTGTFKPMPRFSYWVVPFGTEPSALNSDTFISSP